MALITDVIIIIIAIMESKSLKVDIHFSTTNIDHSTKTNQRLTKLRANVLKIVLQHDHRYNHHHHKISPPSHPQSRSSSHQIESKSLKIEPQLTNIGAALADLKAAAWTKRDPAAEWGSKSISDQNQFLIKINFWSKSISDQNANSWLLWQMAVTKNLDVK